MVDFIDNVYQWVVAITIGVTVFIVLVDQLQDRFSTPMLVEGADDGGFKGFAVKAIFIA